MENSKVAIIVSKLSMKKKQWKDILHSLKGSKIPGLILLAVLFSGLIAGNFLVQRQQNLKMKAVENAPSTKPISGTFVQPDTALYTESYYNSFFENLKEAGMDTAIFTSVANLNNSCPLGDIENIEEISWFDVQKPEIPGLKPMLNVAKKKNIKLFFGGVSITNPTCFSFLAGEAGKETTTKGRYIAATIRAYNKLKTYVESQGWDWNDPNFIQGFYLGYEVDITDYLNNPDPNVLSYFIDMSSQLKNAFPNKLLLHSPYKHKGTSYNTAFSSINNFLYKTTVDIIAPQDGVGADLVISYQENSDHFRALKDAVTSYNASHPGKNRQAWANVETFMLNSTKDDFIPSDITRVSQQITSSQPYVSKQITWIFQHTMATIPELYNTASWTKQYTPINAIRRQNLRNGYMALYAPQEKPFIKHIFPWNADMAIKGELGVTGQTAAITVLYLDSQKNFYQKNFNPIIKMEEMQVVYIPLSSLAGIDLTLPYSAYVKQSTPPATPTLAPTPLSTPTSTPTAPPAAQKIEIKLRLQAVVTIGAKAKFKLEFKQDGVSKYAKDIEAVSTANGAYLITLLNSEANLDPGVYDLYVKADSHLRKKFAGVELSGQSVAFDYSQDERDVLRVGDANNDNKISIDDISQILVFFNSFSTAVDPANAKMTGADLNKDGFITIQDLALFGINWSDFEVVGD